MSVNGISNSSSTGASAAANPQDTVALTVLKKAVDINASETQSLINAATSASSTTSTPNLPPNLGQNVNTTA
jgi:hypothetical protein